MTAIPNPITKTYSFEQYLEIEAQNEYKSEFYDGLIVAMAGSTIEHSKLTRNIQFAIQRSLKNSTCDTYNNDIKVYVRQANRGFYPDVSVVCGEIESHNNRNGVIINPSVIVEVLSDSTEVYDRSEKFEYYKYLPSFKCYVLVNQKSKQVEVFTKKGDFWAYEVYYENKPLIHIEVLEMTFNIEEVYQGVKLPPPPPLENHDVGEEVK